MITIRPSSERGHLNFGWLDTYHTFSFGHYHDAKHMGFRSLRVINDDKVAPGEGFGTHPHSDMEIITYVLEGTIAHKDSMGNGSAIRPGEVQRMTAGSGVKHSEYNASKSDELHLLQIWILPREQGLKPGYELKSFASALTPGRLVLVASDDARDGSVLIHQDAALYIAKLDPGDTISYSLKPGRASWVQVARGAITLNATKLAVGDGAAIEDESELTLKADEPSEVLLFDLA